ncbi:hypothetical protein BG015_011630 [Linnemannia schmuckeri]|uniref:Yeast cell wall synthesis Kre9/Knh1-like N-terminal domain-containing protein n=1 Tax=Linnemannia schmuckeri TaxID=64567 RepID=A0A9P5RVU9_9FUNG|nr:hypothetical protein BG015_011630 [Linnemannia schmuckeri]
MALAFTTAQSVPPSEEVLVFNPNSTTIWKAGTPVTVEWKFLLADGPFTNLGFDITLRKGDVIANTTAEVRALGRSGRGVSSYAFDLPADIVNGSDYQIGVGPYRTESFVILGAAGPLPPASTTSGMPTNPTTSGTLPPPTTSKPANGNSAAPRLGAMTPLALAGSTLAMFAVTLAL